MQSSSINTKQVYTIGHSTHGIPYFIELLQLCKVNYVIDVRSNPYSQWNSQFNKNVLLKDLKEYNICYIHLGKQFGGLQKDPTYFDKDGLLSYEMYQQSTSFQKGIKRINKELSKGFIIAMMCTEYAPLECHRFLMVGVYLQGIGITVKHILRDKTVKTHIELENMLFRKYEPTIIQQSLFEPVTAHEEILKLAYRLQSREIMLRRRSK